MDVPSVPPSGSWGAATPEPSTCWVQEGFTFEFCCVAWEENDVGVGNRLCWTEGYTFEKCCAARLVPRDLFSCADRGLLWQRFRHEVGLSRDLAGSGLKEAVKRPIATCLLGGLVAALSHLAAVASRALHDRREASVLPTVFDRANSVLALVLRSPVSLDEMLVSGWPIGKVLTNLWSLPALQAHVRARSAKLYPPLTPPEDAAIRRFEHAFYAAGFAGESVRSDIPLMLIEAVSAAKGGGLLEATALAAAAWTHAHRLRALEGPRAPREERPGYAEDAARLLRHADEQLRPHLLQANPEDGLSDPLTALFASSIPTSALLERLQMVALVPVNPLTLVRGTWYQRALPSHVVPQSWRTNPAPNAPFLELQVLPIWDGVSNMVRTTQMPFCHDRAGFLPIISMVARQRLESSVGKTQPPRMRFWEVGANLGDCLLWAAALLSPWSSEQPEPLVLLEATGFEPIKVSADAMRRSVTELQSRIAAVSPDGAPKMDVCEVALGDSTGKRVFGIPYHSAAETTANDCSRQYPVPEGSTTPGCTDVEVQVSTVDDVLLHGSGECPSPYRGRVHHGQTPDLVDFMKVHVQGDEIRVLRGARLALKSGLICVVHLRIWTLQIFAGDAHEIAEETLGLLDGYRKVIVSTEGEGTPLQETLPEVLAAARHNSTHEIISKGEPMLVAWNTRGRCRDSPVVRAVSSMWGDAAELEG
eukprot:TRINITY_DN51060_c0_g1_i1.p1 TRINITY_DN51060_c0_g1~~TRINITY_DN51060_c0_g1_i1.p1  ORF type:complete len:704 (+),score=118.90 TRINITY_DN51060_c0_g1_i1:178-2289(+)